MLNLINHEPDIDKIFLYAKNPCEVKHQLLIKKRGSTGIKYLNDSKDFILYSNDVDDIYKNIEENKKRKILTVFDDMIAGVLSNKKLNSVVTELFIRGRELNIRLNSAYYFVMNIANKKEFQ